MATASGLMLIITGIWSVNPLQINRETSQRLLERGPLKWSMINGGMLGLAVTSRIGFWLWYAVPTCAFACGTWLGGTVVYATYAGARLFTIAGLAWRIQMLGNSQLIMDLALRLRPRARSVCRPVAIAVGLLFIVAFGF